jgi:hypothetical protein
MKKIIYTLILAVLIGFLLYYTLIEFRVYYNQHQPFMASIFILFGIVIITLFPLGLAHIWFRLPEPDVKTRINSVLYGDLDSSMDMRACPATPNAYMYREQGLMSPEEFISTKN